MSAAVDQPLLGYLKWFKTIAMLKTNHMWTWQFWRHIAC